MIRKVLEKLKLRSVNIITLGVGVYILYILTSVISIILKFAGVIKAPWFNFPMEYGVLTTPYLVISAIMVIYSIIITIKLYYDDSLYYDTIKEINFGLIKLNLYLFIYSLILKGLYPDRMIEFFSIIPGKGIIINFLLGICIIIFIKKLLLRFVSNEFYSRG